MRKTFLVLLLFVLFSCSNQKFDYSNAFNERRYDEILAEAESDLNDELNPDALLYRAKVHYLRGTGNAHDAALLYLLVAGNDDENGYRDALKIILHTSEDEDEKLYAGKELEKNSWLGYEDMVEYLLLLNTTGRTEEGKAFYLSVKGRLSSEEDLDLLLNGEGESVYIISMLDQKYMKEGLSDSFALKMEKAIPIFERRGEEEMILPLLDHGSGGNPDYALALGDFYLIYRDLEKAYEYYKEAEKTYPRLTRLRLEYLERINPVLFPLS